MGKVHRQRVLPDMSNCEPRLYTTDIRSLPLKKRLLSGGAWAFSGRVVTAFAALAINALLARLLTPEAMGTYFLTFSLVSVASVISGLGLEKAVVRLVAESMGTGRPGRAKETVRLTIICGALGALIVAAMLAMGVGEWLSKHVFHSHLMTEVTGLAALWVIVILFQGLLAETFRGFHDIRLATIFGKLFSNLLSVALFAGLWFMQGGSDLKTIIILSVVAGMGSNVVAGLLLNSRLKLLNGQGKLYGKEVLEIAWPLWITSLALFVLMEADLWIVGIYRPQEDVAIYGAAFRLVTLVAFPLLIVNAVVSPLIAEMYAQGRKNELEKALQITATIAGLPAIALLMLLVLYGDTILEFVYGAFYRDGAMVLALLSLGQVVSVWAGSCGLTLSMTGFQKAFMMITIGCGLVNILGAVFLVQTYGPLGVACAAAFSLALANILSLLAVKRDVGIWTHIDLMKILHLIKR